MLTHSLHAASLALLVTATTVVASPLHLRSSYSVKDSHNVPKGWSNIGAASPEHIINVQIGLTQHKVGELETHLYESKAISTRS